MSAVVNLQAAINGLFPLHGEDGWLLVAFDHADEGKGSKLYTYSHPVQGTVKVTRAPTWVRS